MEKHMHIHIKEIVQHQEFRLTDFQMDVVDVLLINPMKLPFGTVVSRPSGVVRVTIEVNKKVFMGFGEGATLSQPLFTDDSGETIAPAMTKLCERLAQKDLSLSGAVKRIAEHKFPEGKKFPTARMTVEMALLDAVAKTHGISVAEMLGVPSSVREIPFGKSIGGGDKEKTLSEAESALKDGARKIKLKITPNTTDTVIAVVQMLAAEHKDLELMIDANGTFDPENTDHLSKMNVLDGLGLVMFEEPVSRVGNIKGIEAVQLLRNKLPNLKTPICLDDCLTDLTTTRLAITSNLADIVNIKPGRIGSIMLSIEIANLCKQNRKQIMVGGMLEATPGRCMTTTLAALFHSMGNTIPGDLSLAQERLATDLVPLEKQLTIGEHGGIILPTAVGWGFDELHGGNL